MNRSVKLVLAAIVGVCGVVLCREHLPLCCWLEMTTLAGAIALVIVGAGKLYLMWAAKRPPQRRPNTGMFVLWCAIISLLAHWTRPLHMPHRTAVSISILFGVVMFSLVGVMFARIMHWQRVTKLSSASK